MRYRNCFIAILLLATLGYTATAQSYSIRVDVNANIRAQPSLDAAWLESVPPGTILEVLDQFNRWLKINRHGGAWMASWLRHQRVETTSAPSVGGKTATTPSVGDNCCGVDRQCHNDQDWIDGWQAFQSGQCGAPATSAAQPTASQASDNCCGIDRHCSTDQEWIDGYHAYQNRQCGAPASGSGAAPVSIPPGADNCCQTGWPCQAQHEWDYGHYIFKNSYCGSEPGKPPAHIFPPYTHHSRVRIIELTPGFTTMVNRGWELLRIHAPHWYNYAANALTIIQEVHEGRTGVYGASGIVDYHHAPHSVRPYLRPQDDYTMAETLVHEACHVYQDREGRGVGGPLGWINEYECELYAVDAAMLMGGRSHNIPGSLEFLNDPTNQDLWWW